MTIRKMLEGLRERNCILALIVLFMALAIWIAAVPYDPSTDLADATTNDIWIEYYDDGIYHIPYDEWTYPPTQSVVVEYRGEYVVVNEKGPGHVMAMLPFRAVGTEFLFGPFMAGLAVLGTYMLGKRLFGWQVGFAASLLVMFNLTAIVMWHRYYWTDASTMHFLVFSVWLFVEGVYRYNGRSLDPRNANDVPTGGKMLGIGLMALSGLVFGASVSTRYPTGLLVVIFPIFLAGFFLKMAWPDIGKRRFIDALKKAFPATQLMGAFALGLLAVLVPLMMYNSAYFGGPLNSGYDATSLMEFSRTGAPEVRNATSAWSGDLGSLAYTSYYNLFRLMPTFLSRMPVLLFLPLGIYCMRKRRSEAAMLLAWITINAFTYLSLEWVGMYARPDLVPWEPRYWMPSLPALAIVGGLGIHRTGIWVANRAAPHLALAQVGRRSMKILCVGAIVGILVFCSAVPAASYLRDPPPAVGGHQPPQAISVTTDMLLANPGEFVNRYVILENAVITYVGFNELQIRSMGSENPVSVAVRFVEWPPGTLPELSVGRHVTVRGLFHREPRPPPEPPAYSIGVKYDTLDFVRILN